MESERLGQGGALGPGLQIVNDAETAHRLLLEDRLRYPEVACSLDDRARLEPSRDDEPRAEAASTVFFVPVTFEDAELSSDETKLERCRVVAKLLLAKTMCEPNTSNSSERVWIRSQAPLEAVEFDEHFRELSGLSDSDGLLLRFSMTARARELAFAGARLWAFAADNELISRSANWSDVSLLLAPNASVMVFRLDWKSPGDSFPLTLADLRMWSYLGKFKSCRPGVVRGWTFGGADKPTAGDTKRLHHDLGPAMFGARYGGEPIGLGGVAAWLARLPFEDARPCVNIFSHCPAMNVVRLVGTLDVERNQQTLIQILNQEGAAGRWDGAGPADVFVRPRLNRLLGVSREGAVVVEWGASSELFGLAMGALTALMTHVLVEREVLVGLCVLAAKGSRSLGEARTVLEKQHLRKDMMALQTELVRYNLQMDTDQCGGRKMFRNFFSDLRARMQVSDLRDKLREGLNDTFSVVELDYQEEHREAQTRHALWQTKSTELRHRIDEIGNRQREYFSFLILIASAVFLPFNFTAGIFGMNNGIPDPTDNSYWGYSLWLTACGVAGLVFLCVVLFLVTSKRAQRRQLKQQLIDLDVSHHSVMRSRVTAFMSTSSGLIRVGASGGAIFGNISSARGSDHNIKLQLLRGNKNSRFLHRTGENVDMMFSESAVEL